MTSRRVLLMFQPGEEGYHGARYMIEEGCRSSTAVRTPRNAAHLPTVPTGELQTRAGR
jgi:hippurate hydrolase